MQSPKLHSVSSVPNDLFVTVNYGRERNADELFTDTTLIFGIYRAILLSFDEKQQRGRKNEPSAYNHSICLWIKFYGHCSSSVNGAI